MGRICIVVFTWIFSFSLFLPPLKSMYLSNEALSLIETFENVAVQENSDTFSATVVEYKPLKENIYFDDSEFYLLEAIPEEKIYIYRCKNPHIMEGVLLQCGSYLYKLNWPLFRNILRISYGDYDFDQKKELAVANCTAAGNIVSYEDLHIIEFLSNHNIQDFRMSENLFKDSFAEDLRISLLPEKNQITIQMGNFSPVIFSSFPSLPQNLNTANYTLDIGEKRNYILESTSMRGIYSVQILCDGMNFPDQTAFIEANIFYSNGNFSVKPIKIGILEHKN